MTSLRIGFDKTAGPVDLRLETPLVAIRTGQSASVWLGTRPQAGSDGRIEESEVAYLCEQCIQSVRSRIHGKQLHVSVDISATRVRFRVAARELESILIKLLNRAVDVTESHGEIGLTVDTLNGALRFTVWDGGVREILPTSRGQRVSQSQVFTAGASSNAPLHEVQALVEAQGGHIQVEHVGRVATRIHLILPSSPVPQSQTARPDYSARVDHSLILSSSTISR
jgi:signal transduction histidine kinase